MGKGAVQILVAALRHSCWCKRGIKVLNSIPNAYWGRWAPVSETPRPKSSTDTARLQCIDAKQAQKKTPPISSSGRAVPAVQI